MAPGFIYVGSGPAAQANVTDSPAYGTVKVDKERQGILTFAPNPEGGAGLTEVAFLELNFHVGWLATHPTNGHLYGVGGGKVHTFRPGSFGELSLLASVDSIANGNHIEVTRDGKWALIISYGGSLLVVFPIREDCTVGEASDSKHHFIPLNPALADRQECCHPHQVRMDPTSGNWALSCDLGADRVWVYRFDAVHGGLIGASNSSHHLALPEGSGPRHLDFHPNGRFVYVLCELSGKVAVCTWDAAAGQLAVIQEIYALPEGVACCRAHHSGNAHILVAPDGRSLYASTRTDNMIVVFRIDESSGKITKEQHVSTRGVCPRHFHLDWTPCEEPPSKVATKTQRWPRLRVGNQDSQNLVDFPINPEDGLLDDNPMVFPLEGFCPQVILGPYYPSA